MIDTVLQWIAYIVLGAAVAYMVLGLPWIVLRFLYRTFWHREDPTFPQKQKEADATPRQKHTLAYAEALRPLVEFVKEHNSWFRTYARILKENNPENAYLAELDVTRLLLADLTVLVRKVACPEDTLRTADSRLLLNFCRLCDSHNHSHLAVADMSKLLEESSSDHLLGLRAAQSLNSTTCADLIQIYIDLTKVIAGFPNRVRINSNREAALATVETELKSYLKFRSTRRHHGSQSTPDESPKDPMAERRALLGVNLVYSLSELKTAYRAKAAAWHPDKLAQMAPELQKIATEHTAKLNDAYQVLTFECRRLEPSSSDE